MGRPNFLASKRADRHQTLTMQDRLQDVSITYWGKPIDEALEPHLHGASKALTARTWSRWSKKYCVEMLKLVPLVSAAEANELLTAKMATLAVDTRDDGMRPCVVRYVLADVRRLLEQSGGVIGGSAVASGDKTFLATPPGRLGGEKQLVGHKKGRKRGKRAHGKMVK